MGIAERKPPLFSTCSGDWVDLGGFLLLWCFEPGSEAYLNYPIMIKESRSLNGRFQLPPQSIADPKIDTGED
jgi:hypothetical protein